MRAGAGTGYSRRTWPRGRQVLSWFFAALRDGGHVSTLLFFSRLSAYGISSDLAGSSTLEAIGYAIMAVILLVSVGLPVLFVLWLVFRQLCLGLWLLPRPAGAATALLVGAGVTAWPVLWWWNDYQESGVSRDDLLWLIGVLVSITLTAVGASQVGYWLSMSGLGVTWNLNDKRTLDTQWFTREEVERIRSQADGTAPWPDVNQLSIGNSYLLAVLQAYSLTPQGRQVLSDRVSWDRIQQAFVVTFYDNGEEIRIPVREYFTKGNQNGPSIINVYERGYAIFLVRRRRTIWGGRTVDALKDITGKPSTSLDTSGTRFSWQQWSQIEDAVRNGRPVVGETPTRSSGRGDWVQATTDTNDDGVIDDRDETGFYSVARKHIYTVVGIDHRCVILHNPWGHNRTADFYTRPPTDQVRDGYIRVTRQDYERHFDRTLIGVL